MEKLHSQSSNLKYLEVDNIKTVIFGKLNNEADRSEVRKVDLKVKGSETFLEN